MILYVIICNYVKLCGGGGRASINSQQTNLRNLMNTCDDGL